MSKRRKFSEEFKREALELTRQPGVNISRVARDIGIGAGFAEPLAARTGERQDQGVFWLGRSARSRDGDVEARAGRVTRSCQQVPPVALQLCH